MIGRLNGRLIEKNPTDLLIECGGVGYEVKISLNTFSSIGDAEAVKNHYSSTLTPVEIRFSSLLPLLTDSNMYFFQHNKTPLSDYQSNKMMPEHHYSRYLADRTIISTRQLDWTKMSFKFTASAMRYQRRISNSTVLKIIYDNSRSIE
jgi:hypothetical protein